LYPAQAGLWPLAIESRISDPAVSIEDKSRSNPEEVSPMYDRLLMAVDHSDVTKRVINAARELASLSKGEVWVLHVQEKEVMPRGGYSVVESAAEARSAVEHATQELDDAGIKTHYEVRTAIRGQAGHEIVAAARAHDADVIVMGSRGRTGMIGVVLGSTAHQVIHLSDRPVLVVR
jgi:nucleotide-binding universal stress UspA family protein